MQLSAFNVYVAGFPASGETLVYNTFSGGSVVLDDPFLARLRDPDAVAEAAAAAPDLYDADLGLIVESRAAEERDFHVWLSKVKNDGAAASALISTSYACNLACTYCYQEDVMSGLTMSAETADATAGFLAARLREAKSSSLEVSFIGGEPLLHPRLIEQIAAQLGESCREAGARFSFQIITNGTLMTRAVIERLVAVGLTGVQVTVDGDECSHGLTRVDKRGRNTFHQTWDNVLACIDLVPISLQGNYTDENLHGFVPLLARLVKDGVDPARVPRIKFKPALAALGTPEDAGIDSCTWSNARPEVQLALGDAVRAFGYRSHDHLELGPCAIHQIHHYSIGPDGLVFKCPGFLGKPEWATGTVAGGLTDRHRRLNVLASTRECGACTWRPSCAGGCIATQWVAARAPEGINCERSYFDSVGVEVLKRNYFLDTLDRDHALAAIESLPGRTALPTEARTPRRVRVPQSPDLVQLRPRPRAPANTEMRS